MKRLLVLFVSFVCFVVPPRIVAQNAAVQADATTGVLWRPSTFFTGNAAALAAAVSGTSTFQPLDATLTGFAATTFNTAGQVAYATGTDAFTTITTTAFGRSLWDDADASASRTTLGLVIGTNVQGWSNNLQEVADADPVTTYGLGFLSLADATASRLKIGTVIGTDVQAYDATLAGLAGVTTSTDKLIYSTGIDTFATSPLTPAARALLDDVDAGAQRSTLGLIIGTQVQAYDADLAALAGLTSAADALPYFTGSGTAGTTTLTSFGRTLLDDANATAVRQTIGADITTGTITTISAAGNSALSLAGTLYNSVIYTGSVSAGSGAYTHVLFLSTSAAPSGGTIDIRLAMPASENPTIEIRDASASGTLLDTITGTAYARTYTARFRYNGTAWLFLGGGVAPWASRDSVNTAVGLRDGLANLQCDGATSNRRLQTTGINLAGSDFTVGPIWFQMPTSNPASHVQLFEAFSVVSASVTTPNSLLIYIDPSGDIRVRAVGALDGDLRTLAFSSIRSTYSGQRCQLWLAFTGNSTTAPSVWLFGETGGGLLTGGTETTVGTPPNWADAALVSTYLLQGYNMPAGPFIPGAVINRRFAQTDIDAYRKASRFTYADAAGGATADLAVNGTFDVDPTTAPGGSYSLDAGVAWNSGTGAVDFNLPGGSAFMRAQNSASSAMWLMVGRRYRITFTLSNYVSGAFRVVNSSGAAHTDLLGSSNSFTANGTFAIEIIAPAGDRIMIGAISASGGPVATIDNLQVFRRGVLTDPTNGVQPCSVVADTSPGRKPWFAVGYTPNTEARRGQIRADLTWSGTHESKALVVDDALFTGRSVRIDSIIVDSTAATTGTGITIGDGDSATYYVGSTVLSASAPTELTLSARIPASTSTADRKIYVDPDSANFTGTVKVTVSYTAID